MKRGAFKFHKCPGVPKQSLATKTPYPSVPDLRQRAPLLVQKEPQRSLMLTKAPVEALCGVGAATFVAGMVALAFSAFKVTLLSWLVSAVAWCFFFWLTRWKPAAMKRRMKRELYHGENQGS
jgi:hypothetical protein